MEKQYPRETELSDEEVENFWRGQHDQRHWMSERSILFEIAIFMIAGIIFGAVCFCHT